jgi:hypothetical protein
LLFSDVLARVVAVGLIDYGTMFAGVFSSWMMFGVVLLSQHAALLQPSGVLQCQQ